MTKNQKEAYEVYLSELNKAEGNFRNAAINADKKGFNPACCCQDQWYDAIAACDYETHS